MKFDINAARSSGYSDDEIADYLAKENNFDLGAALKSGYSASEVVGFLTGTEAPAPAAPVTDTGDETARLAARYKAPEKPGIIERVGSFLKPEFKSVMEGYQPTPEQQQAELDKRLSYGAGPIRSDVVAAAANVNRGRAKANSPTVAKVAKEMERRGERPLDAFAIAQDEGLAKAARDSKADEFRSAGEWAVDTLSNLGQGAVGLVQLPINIIAPSSDIAATLRDTQKQLQAQESDVLKAQREQLRERVQNEDGFFDKYAATVVQLVTSPALGLSEAVKQVPNFLGIVGASRLAGAASAGAVGLAGRASPTVALGEAISGGAIQAGARAAGTTAGGIGASMVMTGGDAAGGVYEKLTDPKQTPLSVWQQNPDYQKLVADGKSSGEAIEEIATAKARMAALVTAPLGLLGFMGAEAAVASRGLGKATAEALTVAGAGKMLAKDLIGEQLEEGGTQFGGNVISRTVDPKQSLTEGVPEAMATALVTSAPFSGVGAASQYQEARAAQTPDLAAERNAVALFDVNNYDPTLIDPTQTTRQRSDVGPSAPVSFTPVGAPTQQAGLVDIVVPTTSETIDVSTGSLPPLGTPGSSQQPGNQLGGGVELPGSTVADQAGQRGGSAGQPGTDVSQVGAVPGTAGERATRLNRPFDRATDQDLLARTEASIASQENNNAVVEPAEQWFGRKGDGYATEVDAMQALPGRQRMFQNLDWKVEPMANGKFRLAGYEQQNSQPAPTVGTTEAGAGTPQPTQAAPIAAAPAAQPITAPSGKPFSTQQTAAVYAQQNGITGYSTVRMGTGFAIQPTETNLGTQTTQAKQGQTQGQEAPVASARESSLEDLQQALPDSVLAELARNPGASAKRASVQAQLDGLIQSGRLAAEDAPQLGTPDADAEATVNVLGNLFGDVTGIGQRVVAFAQPGGVNGFELGGIAFVNTAPDTDVSAPRTGLHEIRHVVERIAKANTKAGLTNTPAQKFTAQMDSIFDDMTDEGKRAYIENFLHKEELNAIKDPSQREARIQELMQDTSGKLRSEMVADFLGNRSQDRAFLIDLAKADPKGFEGFVKKWLAVIDNLIAKLRGGKTQGDKESARVDQYIRDLNKAKMIARDALIEFRKGNLEAQGQQADATGGPAMSAKQGGASPVLMNLKQDMFKPQTAAERKAGFAIRLNNPVTLRDGSRLSGFTDPVAQTTFFGYDKNGERFTIRRDAVSPDDVVSSKDSNRTAEAVRKGLDSLPAMSGRQPDEKRVGKVDTHVLNVARGERTTSDRTMLTAQEKVAVRTAANKMKMTISEVEEMVRDAKAAHPVQDGWAPLTFTGAKVNEDTGKFDLQYKTIPYEFNLGSDNKSLTPGTLQYTNAVGAMAQAMLREVRTVYQRAQAGDKAASNIIAQSGWYKEMRTRLRQEFGGLGDLFADLLGATSPNTPVRTNWDNSVEALRLATAGKFDELLPRWVAWSEGVQQAETKFRAFFDAKMKEGLSKKVINELPEYQELQAETRAAREFPEDMLPIKANGKKFGFNGQNVARAMVDLWRVVQNADPDIGRGGTAPKAINFSGNLIGFRSRATIDVWAARMLQRLSGGLRIPSMAEGGVSGEALEDGRNTLQFGFGQDVFTKAVELIRKDLELSESDVLRTINDDDLQALVWFIEKEVWTKGNWTSAAGEGGSFEFESDLAGVADRERVRELRKVADSSVASSQEQRDRAEADITRLRSEMDAAVEEPQSVLDRNADAINADKAAPKGQKLSKDRKEEIKLENAAAREAMKKIKSGKPYKALKSELNKAKAVLKKPTQEQRQEMRAGAVAELGKMARTVDRYTLGLSIQKGAEQGMEPTVPTDQEMADLAGSIIDAAAAGDPGATVIALKAIASEGRYGSPERSLDAEFIVTDGFDPRPLAAATFTAAQEGDQDSAFVARVLRPDEQFDALLHRPGIEIYFRDMNQAQEAARIMAETVALRINKPMEVGPGFFSVGGYTVIVDGRPTAATKAGTMGKPVGMRVIYMPEFEARYGIDSRLADATENNIRDIVMERADDLGRFASAILRRFDGVSFAGRFNYEVDTRFAGEYQGAIDAYSGATTAAGADQGRGQPWQGRPIRQSIAAAVGRLSVNGSEPGAEVSGRDDSESGPLFSQRQRDGEREGGRGIKASQVPAQRSAEAARNAGQSAQEGRLSPLPGAPRIQGFTGPDPRLVSVAEQYAKDNGITLRRQAEYVQVDPERAARIAQAYEAMPHAPNDLRVKSAYRELIKQTTDQYRALEKAGYKFWFVDLNKADNLDYVSSPWNAMRDIRANKEMGVFPTESGFGSGDQVSDNPLETTVTEFRWPVGGPKSTRTAPVLANDLFRAVHDAFGHGLEGAGFRAQGEENAWQAHARLFTGKAVAALTSETRGQNSWVNYGPNGEANRSAKVEDTVFADQKVGLMPEWTWSEGIAGDMPAFSAKQNDQTDTPEFKRWFGDSKVVDGKGKPLVVYRGLPEEWSDAKAEANNVSWFSESADDANDYIESENKANVVPAYLSIKRPADLQNDTSAREIVLNAGVDPEDLYSLTASNAAKSALQAAGYDGIRAYHYGSETTHYAAFSPTQIKSAIGNNGQFDPANPDIRKSNRQSNPNKRQRLIGTNFEVEPTNNIDAARIKLQDDGLRMKRVIEAVKAKGGTVGEAQNFYDANTLMPGRIQAAIDDFKTNIVRPMLDKAAEFGIDMDELSMYSYAKHAKERNAYIASINNRMPDGGSGMTNDEADNILQMVDLAGDTAKFEELHQALMSITSATRQVMLSEGLITPDEFQQLEGAYENYIPLRGFENVDEETGVARPGVGRGVNIRGAETIRAMGRKSKAGDLIENVIRDYERVISRVEKNDVAKVLLDFVLSNPDPDLWGVDVERTKPGFNKAKGTVQYTKSIEKGEDTIGLKVGGEQVYIKFADKELTRALRQAWKDETSGLERATLAMTGWWNNWLRAVLTKYNPAFAVINIPRDALWSGTASALSELGPKGLASYLAAYPKALMASARQEAGFAGTSNKLFGNPQMDARFAEFRAAGGITGGFFMRTLDDINQELRNELLLAGASARNPWERIKSLPPFKLAKMTLKLLEFMGAASENATRFALYQASREQGNSPAKAGILAKDGTTNFNRKGEWGGALNNLYLFFNAAVQGNAQLFRVLKSPAVQASMAGVTGIGMMLALYGASSGGEDDDGEAYWDKIPSYVKERNIVIMLPPGDALAGGIERAGKRGRYVTIPVQYGFNIFPNVGYVMADVLRNAQDPKRGMTPTKGALHLTSTVLGSINPFGGAVDVSDGVQVLLAAMPTLADLPIQLINERGTFGSPSSPSKSPFDLRPDSERMFTSQQDSVSAKIAEALNELGGGNEAKAGSLMGVETSVAPGTIQTLISATTGGLGSFVEQVGTAVMAMTGDDKDLKANKIPFLNKFYGEVDEGANIGKAGERMREVKKLSDEVKAQQKLGLDPELKDEEERLMALSSMQEVYQKQSTMIRKREIEIIKDPKMTDAEKKLERKQLQVERDKLATDMNREYLKVVPK